MTLLSGQTIIVTGAASDIGRNHAVELAAQDARLILNEPSGGVWPADAAARLDETAALVSAKGAEFALDTSDVATPEGARALVASGLRQFGSVDGLVNAAGTTNDRTVANMGIEAWDEVIVTCLRTAFCTTSTVARHWRELSKTGAAVKAAVLNRTSTSAMPGQPGQTNYAAAMSGVATFSISAAREGARYGMRVNCMCGPMDSAALRRASKKIDASGSAVGGDDWTIDTSILSPAAAALMAADCPISGQVIFVGPGEIRTLDPWPALSTAAPEVWTAGGMVHALGSLTLRRDDW